MQMNVFLQQRYPMSKLSITSLKFVVDNKIPSNELRVKQKKKSSSNLLQKKKNRSD